MICPKVNQCKNACRRLGYCTRKFFLTVSEGELAHPSIVGAVRTTTYLAANVNGITPSRCRDWLIDKYRDAKVQIINAAHVPVELNLDHFDATDDEIDAETVKVFEERLREFFRSNVRMPPHGHGPLFVTATWKPHFVTMASIIGASYPSVSQWWPRVIGGKYVDPRVANDNRPPERLD